MKAKMIPAVLVLLFFTFVSTASAQIVVQRVRGQVAYKIGNAWRAPLRPGLRLPQGTKVSTGARSYAVIRVNRHVVTVKPYSMIKLYQAKYGRQTENVNIGLRRGTVNARVNRDRRVKTVFKVSTPVATSSVRGTEEEISYGPSRGMRIIVLKGMVSGENKTGITKFIFGDFYYSQRPYLSRPDPLHYYMKERAIRDIRPQVRSQDEYAVDGYYHGEMLDIWEWYGFSTDLFGGSAYGNYVPVNLIFSWPD